MDSNGEYGTPSIGQPLDLELAIARSKSALHQGWTNRNHKGERLELPHRDRLIQLGTGYALLAQALQTERQHEADEIERIKEANEPKGVINDG